MSNDNSLQNLRHSLAHLLAAAVLELYPSTKQAIGPAIENGFYYDFDFEHPISENDLAKIEEKMKGILKTWISFEGKEVSEKEAKEFFSENPYKLELIDEIVSKGEKLMLYQSGDYVDLCRGGHVKNTKDIKPDAFKLTHIAGAYWRGDEKNKMLTRIYGAAFESKEELEKHLEFLEEAKKRDHRVLGKQLEIFTFADEVGQGLPLWLPKGTVVREELEKWAKETEEKWGYKRVATPHITKEDLYHISGHLPYYADDMYSPIDIEGAKYYLKPMNCPHHHMIYKSAPRSYRDLPLRLTEYGQLYRFELSGVLHGLMRVRGFCQNDAHIYLAEKDVVEEFVKVMELHRYYYDRLGITNFQVKLGLRDPKNLRKKYHGDDAMWAKAEKLTREGLEKAGIQYTEDFGGAAHYGPKGDVIITSVIGKEYAIGTVQVDLYMPERFDLTFTNENGERERPAIIHRAPLGSHERMIGFLLEHFAGAFPVWLAPVQVAVLPVSEKQLDYGTEILKFLKELNVRVEMPDVDETLGKRIRTAEMAKVPYILVVGDTEKNERTVTVRKRATDEQKTENIESFMDRLSHEIKEKVL